jgi:hypothetical protein
MLGNQDWKSRLEIKLGNQAWKSSFAMLSNAEQC